MKRFLVVLTVVALVNNGLSFWSGFLQGKFVYAQSTEEVVQRQKEEVSDLASKLTYLSAMKLGGDVTDRQLLRLLHAKVDTLIKFHRALMEESPN